MKKNKSIYYSIFSFLILALLILPIFSFGGGENLSQALESQSHDNFYVEVIGRDGNELTTGVTTYGNGKAFVFQWADTQKFVFNVNPSALVPPVVYEGDEIVYNLSISIEFLKGYKENEVFYQANTIYKESEFSKSVKGEGSYTQFASFKPELNIDNGTNGYYSDNTSTAIKGFGIYRFKLLINSQETYSDYFIIEPTRAVIQSGKAVAPSITVTALPPTDASFHSTYRFEFTNGDLFKYVDTQKITWYAYGRATDGSTYIFSYQDTTKEEFEDNYNNILWNKEDGVPVRNGDTFTFDDRGVAGKWQIWCEYQYEGANIDQTTKSNVIELDTHNKITNLTILWIILPLVLISIAVTTGVCIYKVKRERIY